MKLSNYFFREKQNYFQKVIPYLFLLAAAVTAQAQNQQITLSAGQTTIRSALEEIEEQTGLNVAYNERTINVNRTVAVDDIKGKPLTEALTAILKGTGSTFKIQGKQILIVPAAVEGQTGTVSGAVIDETGEPVVGASVVEKGTTNGTSTDMDGKFSLNIPSGAILAVSYIGYQTQEIAVENQSLVNITLKEDRLALDEIVVVGYGVQKKSDVTGAVAAIKKEMLEERPQTNIIQTLQGAIAGLNVSITGTNAEGSSSTTVIRGTNSITASNKPLIILDGIPFDGPWSEINANDVQSIEVLKDASSAAIYGARGSNGVILITTKRGEAGKTSVSYNSFFTFSGPVNLPRMMNGEEFWKYKTEAIQESLGANAKPDAYLAQMTATEIGMHENGKYTDWIDEITRNSFSQQHNLSFTGGAGKTKYFISGNYSQTEGVRVNNQFERYNFRVNVDQEFFPWLKFATNTQMGRYDRSGNSPDFGRAFLMIPLAEAYNGDGSVKLKAWESSSEAFNRNPLSNINEKSSDIRYKVITNNAVDIKFPFIKGLSYKLNTGFTYESSTYKNYEGRDTYFGEQLNGRLNTDDWNTTDWIIENILSYVHTFGKHDIFFTGLYSAESKVYEQNTMEGVDFPNDVMTYYQASKAGTLSGSSSYWKQNHISQMGRLNYAYDSRYLLTLTARRDGYSAFGESSKFGVFPSMAVGWNIHNENFYSQNNPLSSLKLRLSYGKNGNEAISGAYATLPNLSTFNYLTEDHKPMYGFYPMKLASPSLGWESTTSFNSGIDFGLWGGRVQGSFDIYRSDTEDLLLRRTIPTINGTSSLLENIGATSNNGFELHITSSNISHKDFKWTTAFNVVHYNTRIKDVGLYDENGKPVDDTASRWFIGEPVDVNYGYVFDGIWQVTDPANPNSPQNPDYPYSIPGYVKYREVDGKTGITPDDRSIIGRTIPDFTASMMNTITYKNFILSFFINAQCGATARNSLRDVNGNSYSQNKMMIEYWTPENPINTYPKNLLSSAVNINDAGFYEKTDFLRLQDVTLTYRLPKSWLDAINVDRLEIFGNLKNAATWTSWTGLDPEFISSQRSAPALRSFVIGCKLDF
ncbi:MAG: TonB-dependent receptor [Tannerella sp.]|jgi:TonB-linked SusC/RagA family outer membrane protein|nr:TonB-dependent receptor [Tannerella sp.]